MGVFAPPSNFFSLRECSSSTDRRCTNVSGLYFRFSPSASTSWWLTSKTHQVQDIVLTTISMCTIRVIQTSICWVSFVVLKFRRTWATLAKVYLSSSSVLNERKPLMTLAFERGSTPSTRPSRLVATQVDPPSSTGHLVSFGRLSQRLPTATGEYAQL